MGVTVAGGPPAFVPDGPQPGAGAADAAPDARYGGVLGGWGRAVFLVGGQIFYGFETIRD